MQYKIETIGAVFSNNGLSNLQDRLNKYAEAGYKFHSVFQIQQPGCLGIGQPSITYVAVYVKE